MILATYIREKHNNTIQYCSSAEKTTNTYICLPTNLTSQQQHRPNSRNMTAAATASVIPTPARQNHRFILIILIHVRKHVKILLTYSNNSLSCFHEDSLNHNGIEVMRTEAFDYLRAWTCGNHLLLCGIALVHCPVADSVYASFWNCHPQWGETVINPVGCHSSHYKKVQALHNIQHHIKWNKSIMHNVF